MISIIIPLYNMGRYVSRCLDSILNQNFQDYEVIIVDDGSTDNSSEIVKEYVNKDTRFHLYCKTNGGVSSARNYGLTKVSGDYCYFVDPDDALLPECLSTLNNNMNDSVDLVVCGYNETNEKGDVTNVPRTIVEKKYSTNLYMEQLLKPSYMPIMGMLWTNLFKNSIIRNNELLFNNDIHLFEDLLFMVKYLGCCSKGVFFTTKPIYNYNRETGITVSRFSKYNIKIVSGFDARCQIFELIHQNNYSKKCKFITEVNLFDEYQALKNYLIKFNRYDELEMLKQKLSTTISRKVYSKYLIRDLMKKVFYPLLPFIRYVRKMFYAHNRQSSIYY